VRERSVKVAQLGGSRGAQLRKESWRNRGAGRRAGFVGRTLARGRSRWTATGGKRNPALGRASAAFASSPCFLGAYSPTYGRHAAGSSGRSSLPSQSHCSAGSSAWHLVFFVLSGFLITGILLAAKGSPRLLPEFLRAASCCASFPSTTDFLILALVVNARRLPAVAGPALAGGHCRRSVVLVRTSRTSRSHFTGWPEEFGGRGTYLVRSPTKSSSTSCVALHRWRFTRAVARFIALCGVLIACGPLVPPRDNVAGRHAADRQRSHQSHAPTLLALGCHCWRFWVPSPRRMSSG
jgi:hypothetical protein